MSLSVLHVAPIWGDPSQGLTYSIPALIASQKEAGADVALLSTANKFPDFGRVNYPINWLRQYRGEEPIREYIRKFDLIVFHSTYIIRQWRVGMVARDLGIPYIITPRGGMTRRAAGRSRLKKMIANCLFFRDFTLSAAAIHCLTAHEAEETKHWKCPIFVVGNGIQVPTIKETVLDRTRSSKKIQAVFLGRLSIMHKGLDILIRGFADFVRNVGPGVVNLHLYGPDDRGSSKALKKLIKKLDLETNVTLHDPVYGDAKYKVLRNADLFCLTSRFEGHSIAVLEALSSGLPCLLTPGTNMAREVSVGQAGWEVAESAVGVAEGLRIACRDLASPLDLRASAYRLSKEYIWPKVAQETLAEYQKLLEVQRHCSES